MTDPNILWRDALYHSKEDLAFAYKFRRLTFGLNPYGKKVLSIWSRLKLIWVAYFTMLGGSVRADAYVYLYCERLEKTARRIRRRQIVIDEKSPNYAVLAGHVMAEKAMLDEHTERTGEKHIN